MTSKKMLIMVMLFITLCLASTSSTPTRMRNFNSEMFQAENKCIIDNIDGQVNVYFRLGKTMNKGGALTFKEKMDDSDLEYVTTPEGVYKIRRVYTIGEDRIEFFEYELDKI